MLSIFVFAAKRIMKGKGSATLTSFSLEQSAIRSIPLIAAFCGKN